MLFKKSSDDSDKVLKVPERKKWRTTKNSNKITGEDVEECKQSKEAKKKKVRGKKTKKKEKEVVMKETKRKDIEKIKKEG